jgi:hypothetical protein
MLSHRSLLRPALLSAALLLWGACGSQQTEEARQQERLQQRLDEAMQTLSQASDRVQREVLRTCDKWKHLDRECVEDEVRMDQLDCWMSDGWPGLEHAVRQNMRQRPRDRTTLMRQNLCMELKRWRKIVPRPYADIQ